MCINTHTRSLSIMHSITSNTIKQENSPRDFLLFPVVFMEGFDSRETPKNCGIVRKDVGEGGWGWRKKKICNQKIWLKSDTEHRPLVVYWTTGKHRCSRWQVFQSFTYSRWYPGIKNKASWAERMIMSLSGTERRGYWCRSSHYAWIYVCHVSSVFKRKRKVEIRLICCREITS